MKSANTAPVFPRALSSHSREPMAAYTPRVVESEIDELMSGVSAIALEGPKGVGKTVTAE